MLITKFSFCCEAVKCSIPLYEAGPSTISSRYFHTVATPSGQVALQDIQGRGQVELAEQPEPNNNYTAKIRVVDPEAGAGHYSFTLAWNDSIPPTRDRSYSSSGGGILTPNGGYITGPAYSDGACSLRWTGQVDGRVRVSFRGNQAYAQRFSGAELQASKWRSDELPRRAVDVSCQ